MDHDPLRRGFAEFVGTFTLGFAVTRRIATSLALVYWSMQLAGATVAAALLRWFFEGRPRQLTNLGAPGLGGGVDHWQGLVIEAILTFFLVWVVFATAVDPGGSFGPGLLGPPRPRLVGLVRRPGRGRRGRGPRLRLAVPPPAAAAARR